MIVMEILKIMIMKILTVMIVMEIPKIEIMKILSQSLSWRFSVKIIM